MIALHFSLVVTCPEPKCSFTVCHRTLYIQGVWEEVHILNSMINQHILDKKFYVNMYRIQNDYRNRRV
jgi:hypothetical protein